MSDKGIIEKCVDLEKSSLSGTEKKDIMNILYKYKDAFSVRDEIGTCPNIDIEKDITDKSPFFIRPYPLKEEDMAILDKEMKRLYNRHIIKDGFSAS